MNTISRLKDLSKVKLIVFDFDGVFTDNKVYINEKGEETVCCSRADGWGIKRLKETGIPCLVLSTEVNKVVKQRCDKLKIPCYQGIEDKIAKLKEILRQRKLDRGSLCFVGNDLNDLECIRFARYSFAVRDAYPEVRRAATWITHNQGGQGAVREICDLFHAQWRQYGEK